MFVLRHCKRLLTPVFKSRVLLQQAGVCRSVCSVSKACSPAPFVSSCQQRVHACSRHLDTNRLYSDLCDDSKSSAGLIQEDSHEMQSQRSSETFSLDVLVSLLRQENAVDICVIKVPEQIKYTEYFIVVSGVSVRHLRAMALYAVKVYKFLKKAGEPNVKIEGKDAEDWMCIDFGNMVVHFMLPETRDVYELEKLWTLRTYDEQLKNIPAEILPEDFIYNAEDTK
ncbi:Mitochondrial assembly of ribosomal large subunit protein 1 [Collichthys lucidus]|uniref:Mitochondrial assembly of ribosomal large subunit protein 1 n=1 Tax=Collichthys lucidus TaxID=240159 RepID=A0A4U5V403_COLLU|nr:Mitochondrial assembly of ribosomal large subunit protein 1 [Collichthys lucidus]